MAKSSGRACSTKQYRPVRAPTQPGGYGTEPATGDLVPKGTYYCENCQKPYEHKDEKQPLPFCPACGIWTLFRTSKP